MDEEGKQMNWIQRLLWAVCIPGSLGFTTTEATACRRKCSGVIRKALKQKSNRLKQSMFYQASQCWYRCARSAKQREEKSGRYLNAITAMNESIKAAKRRGSHVEADQMRLVMVSWIRQITRRKLYDTPEQRNQLRSQQRRALRNVGYAKLDIFTGSLPAHVCVQTTQSKTRFPCKKTRWWSHKQLLAGSYTIRVRYQKGTPAQSRSVRLFRKKQHPEYFTPPYSTLIVTTGDSKAQITVLRDGEGVRSAIGTKRTFAGLILGKYKVTVRYRFAAKQHRWVKLQRNKPGVATFSPPKPIPIDIQSQPAGAWVTIDQKQKGQTPLKGVSVRVGLHQIRLEKPCYLPIRRATSIQSRSNTTSKTVPVFRLKRDPVWLSHQQHHRQLQKRDRTVGLSLIIVGASLSAASAVMLGVGLSQNAQAAQLKREDPAGNFSTYEGIASRGNMLNGLGLAVGGVGIGTLVPGLYFQLVKRPKPSDQIPCQIQPRKGKAQ